MVNFPEMKNWRDLDKPEKQRMPLWAVAVIVVGLLVLGGLISLMFSPLPGKVKQAMEKLTADPEIIEVKVEVPADEEAIRRQLESRLRSEIERERDREIERIRQEADKKIAAIKKAKENAPPREKKPRRERRRRRNE